MEKSNLTLEPQDLILRLQEGQYESSIDVIPEFAGGIFQKISRNMLTLAPWVYAMTIALIISIIVLVGSVFIGGTTSYAYRIILSDGLFIFTNLLIAKTAIDQLLFTIQTQLLVKLKSDKGIGGIQKWLITANDLKWPLLIGFVVFVAYAYLILPTPITIYSIPAELKLGGTMLFWTGPLICYTVLFMFLSLRLSRLDFNLHLEDPAISDELLSWSIMVNLIAYLFAILVATGIFFMYRLESSVCKS